MLKMLTSWLINDSQEVTSIDKKKQLRIGIVSSVGVGKSCLWERFITGKYNQFLEGKHVEMSFNSYYTNGKHYLLNTVQLNEFGYFHSLTFLEDAQANILVLDLNSKNGLLKAKERISDYASIFSSVPLILIGAKGDAKRKVSSKEAIELRDELGALMYIETSAKYGINIDKSIYMTIASAIKHAHLDDRTFESIYQDLAKRNGIKDLHEASYENADYCIAFNKNQLLNLNVSSKGEKVEESSTETSYTQPNQNWFSFFFDLRDITHTEPLEESIAESENKVSVNL